MVFNIVETITNWIYFGLFLGIALSQSLEWRWLIEAIDYYLIFTSLFAFEVKRITTSAPAGYKWRAWDHFSAIRNYLLLINLRTALVATGTALIEGKLAETDVVKVVIDNLKPNLCMGLYAVVVIYAFYELLNIAIVSKSLILISHISKAITSFDIFLRFKDLPAGALASTLLLRNFPHASYTGLTLVVYELAFIGNYGLLISWTVRGFVFASAGWLQANVDNLGLPQLLEQVVPLAKPLYNSVGLDLSNPQLLVTFLVYLFWGTYGSGIGAACQALLIPVQNKHAPKVGPKAEEDDN